MQLGINELGFPKYRMQVFLHQKIFMSFADNGVKSEAKTGPARKKDKNDGRSLLGQLYFSWFILHS